MIGRNTIPIILAIGVGLLASAGAIYILSEGGFSPFESKQETPAGPTASPQPGKPSPPATAALPESSPQPSPKPKPEAPHAASPPAAPTVVPTFDVVVIDPSGEGVIAGRASPGWQVSVQSGETKVAAATADDQGEWSAVLEKPLAAGDHALSLTITSPDGTRALTSQERVRVEVGTATKPAGATDTAASSAPSQVKTPSSPAPTAQSSAPAATPSAPSQAGTASPKVEQSATPATQAPSVDVAESRALPAGAEESKPASTAPKLVFKTVDYNDKDAARGSVAITGQSDPGATIKVYSGEELLGTVRADRDGRWSMVAEKTLAIGKHNFRAERIDTTTGAPSARASVAIERLVPKPPEIAAKETKETVTAAAPQATSGGTFKTKDVYTVRRGDTLWAIAKRYFGSGLRYPTIFQDNRETINDPNLIHPQQQVKVPPD
ncbi:MAG: LysM peptidoglycan-binding domain-containing protein [Methyloceanibacter sp.]